MNNNNFRVRGLTRASSTTLPNDSSELQMQGMAREAEWTDEKHRMYLKCIEASFVNQLYDSKQMQFKVLRDGRWEKISFERENLQKSRLKNCHDLTANPWIRHYRSSSKQGLSVAAETPSLEERVTTTSQFVDVGQRKGMSSESEQLHLCESHVSHQDMLCTDADAEMSDQNFVDEEVEDEKENNGSKVKRLKSSIMNDKGNDGMVHISESSAVEDVNKNCVSAAYSIEML